MGWAFLCAGLAGGLVVMVMVLLVLWVISFT